MRFSSALTTIFTCNRNGSCGSRMYQYVQAQDKVHNIQLAEMSHSVYYRNILFIFQKAVCFKINARCPLANKYLGVPASSTPVDTVFSTAWKGFSLEQMFTE